MISRAHAPLLLATFILVACNQERSSVPEPMPAALSVSPTSIELVANSGTAVSVSITNSSASATATVVEAILPSDWSDVTQDASRCANLGPKASCTISFTPGNGTHQAATVSIRGRNAIATSLSVLVSPPEGAIISATGSPLSLLASSGTAGIITITNGSLVQTASGIAPDLSGTPLSNKVTVDASGCASVAPGASCELRFTPGNSAVTATSFPIQGTNTNVVSGKISIAGPTSAMISVTGSPLLLAGSYGTAVPGALTVTNNSTALIATNITAILAGTALAGAVTEDASDCASVAPGASCTLRFTPTVAAAVGATTVVIQGDNTSQAGASIAVNAAAMPTLIVTGSPLVLNLGGSPASISVTNSSATQPALNIQASITGSPLAGYVTVSGTTCGTSLPPGASCDITFSPASNPVATAAINVAGSNTNVVSAEIGVRVPLGGSYAGGVVWQVDSSGLSGHVVTSVDVSTDIWGAGNLLVSSQTMSLTDGAANTATILSVLGTGGPAYAALDCYNYTGGGASVGTWYLPAQYELLAVVQNADPGVAAVLDPAGNYWTSNEATSNDAWTLVMPGPISGFSAKGINHAVRCMRAF